MRKNQLAAVCVLACAFAVAGCYETLTSIVTPEVLEFDADLPGHYEGVAPTTGTLDIKKGDGKAYAYVTHDEKGAQVNKGKLWLVKLGDSRFYQVSVDGSETTDGSPVYAIGRVSIDGKAGSKTLTGYACKSEDTFFSDPAVTTAEYSYKDKDNGETKKGKAINMPPEKLRARLVAVAGEMNEATLKFRQVAPGGK